MELGAAGEYARLQGASGTGWGLEAKWATELTEGFSVGARIGPGWAAHVRPRYHGVSLMGLASWQPLESVALHFNLGRDLARRAEDEIRYVAAVEWAPATAWSLVAERSKESSTHSCAPACASSATSTGASTSAARIA